MKYDMRTSDSHGRGHFGAPRGTRTHRGVDLGVAPGTTIPSPVSGVITKLGYCYSAADKKHLRYVQISDGGYDFRMFYVKPSCEVGDTVTVGHALGESQELGSIYTGITEHVHLEIKKGNDYVDPTPVYLVLKSMQETGQ